MNSNNDRILAIAVRARWLGFAIVDHACDLADWGMIFFALKKPSQVRAAKKRLGSLILNSVPSMIAVAVPELWVSREAPTVRSLLRWIRSEASTNDIRFEPMSRRLVRLTFRDFDAQSKEEIAAALAKLFPFLRWKLPPQHKIWQKEHYRMALFDAVAVGVACWRQKLNHAETHTA